MTNNQLPDLDLSFTDIKLKIQQSFVEQGKMKPYPLQKLIDKLEFQAQNLAEALAITLKDRWNHHFPGVKFSEELLAQEVSKVIRTQISEKIEEFSNELKKENIVIIAGQYIASSVQATFIAIFITSFVTIPLSFWFLTLKMNYIPIFGILLFFGTVGSLIWSIFNLNKNDSNNGD